MAENRETRAVPELCEEFLTPGRPGDEKLLERLARCLGRDLHAFALRRCGNPADAEDVVQDAMANALRYLNGFRGETSLRSWLLRLVSSACVHQRRGRRNDPRLHTPLEADEQTQTLLADLSPLAEEQLMVQQRLGTVIELLDALPETERVLLLRHEGDEVPLAQLAAETGQSVAAIRTRLFRSRQKLRQQLQGMLHDEEESEEPLPG